MDRAILLIERDLGHAFWLGRTLDHAGFQTFPARTVADAATLLRELHLTVDILMLDCLLPGAVEFVWTLRSSRKSLKVICLNGERDHRCRRGTSAFGRKPVDLSEHCRMEWAEELREMLSYAPDLGANTP
jgi:DNA-binding response OmpR family regulator